VNTNALQWRHLRKSSGSTLEKELQNPSDQQAAAKNIVKVCVRDQKKQYSL
jgi:hypothetical protein